MSIFDKDKASKFDDLDVLMERNTTDYFVHKLKETTLFGLIKDEDYSGKYVEAVLSGANYLRIKLTDRMLESNDNLEFDLNDMCNYVDTETKHFIESPKLKVPDSMVYIIDDTKSPHFHINVDNETIDEADYIAKLPNYNCIVSDDKLCSWFKGLTVYEARDLLKQMNILPKNGMFEAILQFYDEEKDVHKNYFLSIIYMLLKTQNKYDVKRARIFADNLGINFDFTPYEDGKVLDGGIKKKTPFKL